MKLDSLRGANILITGGAGMIGSTIAQLAVRNGAHVTILDALLPLYGGNLFNLHGILDQIEFIQGDIRDASLLGDVIKGRDFIFNLAGQVSYIDSNTDPMLDLDINCRGHLHLLEACKNNKSTAKIIFSSSRFVYGKIEYNPVDEKHPFNCLSIYGIHKLAGEKYYRFYQDAYGLKTLSVRIANPYGPRQQMRHSKYGIVNWFIRMALQGNPLTIYGDGLQKRDYIYNGDLAAGCLALALTPDTDGEIYNLGSGIGTPFREMTKLVAESVEGIEVKQIEWPADRYFVETGDFIGDISKITQKTGWIPETSLEAGINNTIDYYKKYHDKYWNS